MNNNTQSNIELLSPVGNLESAYAAFSSGADAIYLGLKKFSARSGTLNFAKEELEQIVFYAHGQQPRKKVFAAVNTIVREDEIPELVELIFTAEQAGIDAVIIQDIGVYSLIKEHFPKLALHASTQMAVHSSAGCRVLKKLGFERVVLARELTIDEVKDASSQGIETEVFIHGALCYSYSGLCLYSAMCYGHSANRGSCTYPCREFFSSKNSQEEGYLFSMMDLALLDDVKLLEKAGVASLKIEGRKRSTGYIASATELYRRILDGNINTELRNKLINLVKVSFGRKWTELYLKNPENKEVINKNTVGHLGTQIGVVGAFFKKGKRGFIAFKTSIDFGRHDVLKIEKPDDFQVFAFPVDELFIRDGGKSKRVFEAKAGQEVEVALPDDYPFIASQYPVFCASSQAIKNEVVSNSVKKENPIALEIELVIKETEIISYVKVKLLNDDNVELAFKHSVSLEKAQKDNNEELVKAFSKFGDTCFYVSNLKLKNDGFFVPLSLIKDYRRRLASEIESALNKRKTFKLSEIAKSLKAPEHFEIHQNLKVVGIFDNYKKLLDAKEQVQKLYEIILSLENFEITEILELNKIFENKIRIQFPTICRNKDYENLKATAKKLCSLGFAKWEFTGFWGFDALGIEPDKESLTKSGLDITAAWPLYVMNTLAAKALLEIGFSRFTLCLEDDFSNSEKIIDSYPKASTLTIYHNTPLFISANKPSNYNNMEIISKKKFEFVIKNQKDRYEIVPVKPVFIQSSKDEMLKKGINFIKIDTSNSSLKIKDIFSIIKTKGYDL
ncbi:MAG: U32 family peptidase [Alphaproteobacteria bacterium]